MNERLHKMIQFGIVERTVFGEKPPVEVEYRLTPFGFRFMGILDEVRRLQEAIDHEGSEEAAVSKLDGNLKPPKRSGLTSKRSGRLTSD